MASTTELARNHVDHLLHRIKHLGEKLADMSDRGSVAKVKHSLLFTGEIAVGAIAGGVIDGRWGSKEKGLPSFMHVPVTLGSGLLLQIIGMSDWLGKEWSHHISNVGTGLLANYFSHVGFAFGRRVKANGGQWLGAGKPKQINAAVSGQISESQVAHVVSRLAEARAAGG